MGGDGTTGVVRQVLPCTIKNPFTPISRRKAVIILEVSKRRTYVQLSLLTWGAELTLHCVSALC